MTWVVVLAAAAAAALLVAPRHRLVGPGLSGRPLAPRHLVLLGGLPVAAGLGAEPRWVVLATILAAAGLVGARLLRARRARRDAVRTGARVLEACETLAAELGSGRPPGVALARAVEEWPALGPVAEAFRVGADVPHAWRSAAEVPGAGDLRVVAAAWHVAHRTDEGLADTLDRVAHDLRGAQATRRVVEGELASARATARLIAVLPALALTMGSGAGGNPWSFLLGHPLGLACLALGLSFALVGLAWIEALAREVDRP